MNFIQSLFKKEPKYVGILPDDRPASEKAKAWKTEEVVAAGSVLPVFRTVKEGEWKMYTPRNQFRSGTCVAQTTAKIFEVCVKLKQGITLVFSASPIFKERVNKPFTGMVGHNALDIAVNHATCLESEMASQNMTDAQIDELPYPANFDQLNDRAVPNAYLENKIDFDFTAAMVEQFGHSMVWFNTDYKHWCKDIPEVGGKKGEVVHSVTAVDAITLDGVQYLVVEDSWGRWADGKYGKYGQRLISREFFKEACFYSAVFTSFTFGSDNTVHFAPFLSDLVYGQKSADVKRLQDFLRVRGFFPQETESTGYYGAITAKYVYKFQVANKVASIDILDELKGMRVGPSTRKVINSQL
jgi:hypothetical protein